MDTATSTGVGFAEGKAYARIVHCLQSGARVVTDLDDIAFGTLNRVTEASFCPIHTLLHPSLNVRVEISLESFPQGRLGRRPEGWQNQASQMALEAAGTLLDARLIGPRVEARG